MVFSPKVDNIITAICEWTSSEHCAGLQFCIIYRSRNNSNVDRDETIAMLAGLVMSAGKGHKVDLNNPDLAICVEIIKVNIQHYADTIFIGQNDSSVFHKTPVLYQVYASLINNDIFNN